MKKRIDNIEKLWGIPVSISLFLLLCQSITSYIFLLLEKIDYFREFTKFPRDFMHMLFIDFRKFLLYNYLLIISRKFYASRMYKISQIPPVI